MRRGCSRGRPAHKGSEEHTQGLRQQPYFFQYARYLFSSQPPTLGQATKEWVACTGTHSSQPTYMRENSSAPHPDH